MAKRIPVETVVVIRGGKRVRPPLGQPFDFTTAELEEIVGTADKPGLRPQALKRVLSSDADDEAADEEAARTGPRAEGDTQAEPPNAPEPPAGDPGKPAPGARRGKQSRPADDDDL